ncbi:Uncharacterized protein FWK35_00034888, partial [Aphis craccivora]
VDDHLSKAIGSENTNIPIPGDKKITSPDVRDIINNIDPNRIQFSEENRFCVISDTPPLIIFYNMLKQHNTPLEPEGVYQAIADMKAYCINNDITAFSTIKLDGHSSLTNYLRIRTMFKIKPHIFLKELSAVIGHEQHNNSAALHPDEIPNCLLIHIDLANRNLLQTFTAEEILNMTRTLNHFTHDVTKDQRPLTKPLCLQCRGRRIFSTIKIQYAVMDFEFTNLGRDNLILISGALMGQHSPGLVTKLEGRALVLKENRVVTPEEWKNMVHHLVKIFKNKPQTLYPVLAQI